VPVRGLQLPAAGGPATYTSRGLHPTVGALVGWAYGACYLAALPFLALLMGYFPAGIFQTEFGWNFSITWVICSAVGLALVFVINYGGIKENTTVGFVLGLIEIGVLTILAINLIIAGHHNSGQILTTHYATVPGFKGFSGVFAGSVYVILAFIGFDAAAPLGAEARNPKRAVKVAVVGACLMVGLYYVLGGYAAVAYLGPKGFSSFPAMGNGDPWVLLARDVWGVGWVVIFFALLNSAVACTNGIANAATRVVWSMGRSALLPRPLARTSQRVGTPTVATISVFLLSAVVTFSLGEAYGPTTAYDLLGTMVVGLVVPIYMLVNVASFWYYLRQARSDFNVVRHVVIPVVGIAAFVFPLLADLGLPVVSFISPLKPPISYAGPAVAVIYAVGIVVVAYSWKRKRKAVLDLGRALDETEPEPVAEPA
jgi:amino acid transporter